MLFAFIVFYAILGKQASNFMKHDYEISVPSDSNLYTLDSYNLNKDSDYQKTPFSKIEENIFNENWILEDIIADYYFK